MKYTTTKTLLALITAAFSSITLADDLANNLDQSSAGVEYASGEKILAARFDTDEESHTLSSISIEIAVPAGAEVSLQLYSDQGIEPGGLLGSLSAPASLPTSLGVATFQASNISLDASSAYWVVLTSESDADIEWAWSNSNDGAGLGFSTEWGVNDIDEPAFWWTQDIYPLKMQVVVDAANECAADLTGDGELNFFDVSVFLSYFNDADPLADFTGDGAFDFFDVSAFLSAYNAGCQ